jgi:methanethiol S-methyltransferase
MARFIQLLFGTVVYLFFFAVFLYTIGFVANLPWLPKTIDTGSVIGRPVALLIDVLLLGVFAVQHSVMARQGFKRWWTKIVPKPMERSVFVLAATLAVGLLLWQWRPLPGVIWSVEDPTAQAVLLGLSGLGWIVLLVATFLINHFELFGLQQVFDNFRDSSFSPPDFKTPGLYKMVRHPIYLGFVLAFWATPRMSEGHLLWAVMTTGYILVGIWFEERDLIAQFGERYRQYRRRVPMLLPLWYGSRGRSDESTQSLNRRGS